MNNGRLRKRGTTGWRMGAMLVAVMASLGLTAMAQSSVPDQTPSGTLIPAGVTPIFRETQWSLTGQVKETLDDNILMSPTTPQSDALTAVVFNLGEAWSGSRWRWNLQYVPEFNLYAAHSRYNDLAQNLAQGLEYQWTRHTVIDWNLTGHRYPSRSAIPGLTFGMGGEVASGAMGLQQGAIIAGFGQSLGLTHEISRHSRYTLMATSSLENYSRDPSAPVVSNVLFGNSMSWGFSGGWSADVARHLSLGVQSGLSAFRTSGQGAASRYATLEATMSWQLAHTTALSLGAGPSWSRLASLRWSGGYTASASLSHAWGRSQAGIFWNRTTQLSQIQAGLQTDSWGASYVYSAGAWNWGASLGESTSVIGAGAQPLHSRNFVGYWGYRLSPAWIAKVNYSHGTQVTSGLNLKGLRFARDQWAFEIDHIFAGGAHARATL